MRMNARGMIQGAFASVPRPAGEAVGHMGEVPVALKTSEEDSERAGFAFEGALYSFPTQCGVHDPPCLSTRHRLQVMHNQIIVMLIRVKFLGLAEL